MEKEGKMVFKGGREERQREQGESSFKGQIIIKYVQSRSFSVLSCKHSTFRSESPSTYTTCNIDQFVWEQIFWNPHEPLTLVRR